MQEISFMVRDLDISQHMCDGFPDFTFLTGYFPKGLFNVRHPDVKRGPVKGDIRLVVKFSGITPRSPDNTFVCGAGQLVGQPVQPAYHGAEKIQGAAAVLVEGAH